MPPHTSHMLPSQRLRSLRLLASVRGEDVTLCRNVEWSRNASMYTVSNRLRVAVALASRMITNHPRPCPPAVLFQALR